MMLIFIMGNTTLCIRVSRAAAAAQAQAPLETNMVFDDGGQIQSTYFDTFEARETAFNAAVGRLIPAMYQGPDLFWRDFRQITGQAPSAALPAYITSNPRDGLAFGSPLQVLAAASPPTRRQGQDGNRAVQKVARQFGLDHTLYQPIRTLSGGETVRLALAKVMLAAEARDRLVIASPFCWLAQRHLGLLEHVLNGYATRGKAVHILAMTGEESQAPMASHWCDLAPLTPMHFDLQLNDLRIVLSTPINAITAEPAHAQVDDFTAGLKSPCLVRGDNGQGKSLVAKALCGAVGCQGHAAIHTQQGRGRPRLLFQDVVTQTLLRPLAVIAHSAAAGAELDPWQVFDELLQAYKHLADHHGLPLLREGPQSLLAVKLMLIAARLAHCPAALILDEPDWGLTRSAAIALVLTVIRKAHATGVPVILISHKPWWQPLARSQVQVVKTPAADPHLLFNIQLRKENT